MTRATSPRVRSTDRRREQRTSIDILINKYIGEEPHLCRAVNISPNGMLLHKVFEPDLQTEEVTLEFMLPGEDRVLRASGIVLAEHRWARAHAVRFTRLSEHDARAIAAYLADPRRALAVG